MRSHNTILTKPSAVAAAVVVILLQLLVFRFAVHRGGEVHLVFVKSLAVEPQPRQQRQRQQNQQPAPPAPITIEWGRSCLELDSVNLSYQQTLWRKLTSSVPRRDYALQNITLSIKGGGHGSSGVSDSSSESCGQQQQQSSSTTSSFILLVGASSSGKSALLKVLSGSQLPTTGHVRQWTEVETGKRSAAASTTITSKENIGQAKPIILDDRNPYSTSARQKSLQERLEQRLEPYYHGDVTTEQKNTMKVAASRRIIEDVAEACALVSSSSSSSSKPSSKRSTTKPSSSLLLQKSPTELSPSEYYKFRLAEACIDSSCSNGLVCSDDTINDDDDSEKTTTTSTIQIPGPVLFLDEWFDVETSEVVQNVQPTLERIVQRLNGIVICVTHKQQLFDLTTTATTTTKRKETSQDFSTSDNHHGRITRITLSGGKILSID